MKKPGSLALVIFGASGDLSYRKLIPAVFELDNRDMLPDNFAIVGVGRSPMNDDDFRQKMRNGLMEFARTDLEDREALIDKFCRKLFFQSINTRDAVEYEILKQRLETISEKSCCESNYLYYLATPPSMYAVIAKNLSESNLNCDCSGWKRVIIEKPFGYDLESALVLNKELLQYFDEDQLYRIDHYLGKETVQNIMVTRFSNGIFEPLWNRNYIDRVEITSCESIGLAGRGGYYDGSGALRDMLQNHLMQLVGLVAMEAPATADSNAIRNEVIKVFQSLRRIHDEDVAKCVVRGQYTASVVKGEEVKGYREEEGVDPESRTETFAAMKFYIDNWRWSGVPFYIRTGKRMPTRVTEVVIHFKPTPHRIFRKKSVVSPEGNQLIIRIQPDEGLLLKYDMKIPGAGFRVQQVNMDFHYSDLSHGYIPLAYERLLQDCMLGDSTLFQRGDAVEASWRFVEPVLRAWEKNLDVPLYGYPAGSWGPEEVEQLMEGGEKSWRYPCKNLSSDGTYCEL